MIISAEIILRQSVFFNNKINFKFLLSDLKFNNYSTIK